MPKILIIYPHFPPSNLAGVHRPRLFAQHLPAFGWEPIILTVHEKYYEENPDWNLVKLLPGALHIEKVKALPIRKPRLIGDIGLRAFFQLYYKAKEIIKREGVQFLYIPIPSFYCALLGRWLHSRTGVKYGIDYIDPWVHEFPGSNKILSRHWLSTKLAMFLEPIAVKTASLVTGVAAGYYAAVLNRNPHLKQQAVSGAMPYGGEERDHKRLKELRLKPYLFEKKTNCIQLVYAGAMLPKAYGPLESIFKSIQHEPELFGNVVFHFIGTGKHPNDTQGYNIKPLAEQYGLWETVIFEYPARLAYLDVLVHLEEADGIFILGSTEPHYTPSKTYQGVLSGKPLLAVLHEDSTAVPVIKDSGAGLVLTFKGEKGLCLIENDFPRTFVQYKTLLKTFNTADVNQKIFDAYTAYNVTRQLSVLLNTAIA